MFAIQVGMVKSDESSLRTSAGEIQKVVKQRKNSRPLKWTWSGARFVREKTSEVEFENQKPSLRYKRARIYSAQLGRFISRDPLGFVDGMNLCRAYFVPNTMDPLGSERVWHSPRLGLMQVSIYFGPWQCRKEWLEYCNRKCKQRGLNSLGCVWVADIRTRLAGNVGYEAVTYCCCEYKKCDKKIRSRSRKDWNRCRNRFWKDLTGNWGANDMRCGKYRWPVHHVDPIQYGGHPTVPENLIPLPPDVHSNVHYAYRVCEGKTAGNVDYSKPGPYWPHTGGLGGPKFPSHPGGPAQIPGAPGTGWN